MMLLCVLAIIGSLSIISMISKKNVGRIIEVRDVLLDSNENEDLCINNELLQIKHMISKMNQRQKRNGMVREQVVQILCMGNIGKEDLLNDIVRRMSPDLLSPYYCIFCLLSNLSKKECLNILAGVINVDTCNIWKMEHSSILVCILGCNDNNENGMLQQKIEHAFFGRNENRGNMLVVMGRVCSKLREISTSYKEILGMIECMSKEDLVQGNRMLGFRDIIAEGRRLFFKGNKEEALHLALMNHDIEEIEKLLQELLEMCPEARDNALSNYEKYIITEILCETLQEQGADETMVDKLRYIPVEDNNNYLKSVITVLRKIYEDEIAPVIVDMLDFINHNYRDNTMGLEVLAARYNMSLPVISSYIKRKSGKKYTEYISELRIQEACRLLRETDIKLQDIPRKVGYDDYVSFSKKFKLVIGVTPGRYRTSNKVQKSKE